MNFNFLYFQLDFAYLPVSLRIYMIDFIITEDVLSERQLEVTTPEFSVCSNIKKNLIFPVRM